jgi:hypothetical protein
MRRFVLNCVQWFAILSTSVILVGTASAAAPLDAIWVAVPGTISPAMPPAVERISIRASGVDLYRLPQYFARVISICGGTSCSSPEIAATVYSGPTSLFTDFGFLAGSLGATAPRPYVLFGRSPICSALLHTDAMLAVFVNDTSSAMGYFGECFYRQPSPKVPNNSILDKIRKPVQLPHMPPIPRTPFAKGNQH